MSPSFLLRACFSLLIGIGLFFTKSAFAQAQVPDQWDEACISYVPNAISPNGDGINDSFSVTTACQLAELRILIYDPSGEVIFEANNPAQGWDGTLDGEPLPEGYYDWEISFIDPRTQDRVRYQGEFALLP